MSKFSLSVRSAGGLFGLLLLCFSAGISAQTTQSVELCLALDGSGSVSSADFDLQLEGYATAIENPAVVPQDSAVSVIVVQFASSAQVELGPVLVDSQATADQLATDIRAIPKLGGSTNIASAIAACEGALQFQSGFRQVIDVSTDGEDTTDVVGASNSAVAAGVDAINAIGVGSGIDVTQLEALVRPQPASAPPDPGFVLTVTDFTAFRPAIEAKITAEISGGGGAAVSVPALSFNGVLLMIFVFVLASLLAMLQWFRS